MAKEMIESTSDERVENSNRFRHAYRKLEEHEKEHMETIKDLGVLFENAVNLIDHNPREKAIALTKMEEAVMWAVKAITA